MSEQAVSSGPWGEPQVSLGTGSGTSERRRGLPLSLGHWEEEPGGACRKLLLLHANYCSFATGEQPLAVEQQACSKAKTCHPRMTLWTTWLSSVSLGVKPSGSHCPAICSTSFLSAVFKFIDCTPKNVCRHLWPGDGEKGLTGWGWGAVGGRCSGRM